MGFSCNNFCIHCVNWEKQQITRDLTFEDIKKEIDFYTKDQEVDPLIITGGEPTIRPDIIEIIRYAKKKGINNILLQTNGRKLADKKFAKEIVRAGLFSVLFAVHGHTAELHDSRTRAKGSFDETIKGMKNMVAEGVVITTNTVISLANVHVLDKIVLFLAKTFPSLRGIHISFPHPNGNAYKNFYEVVPQFTECYKDIIKALDIIKEHNINPTVESVPLCYLEGHEVYCSDVANYHLDRNAMGTDTSHSERVKDYRVLTILDKRKSESCKICSFNSICDGVWREYAEKYTLNELMPVVNKDPEDIINAIRKNLN